MKVSYSENKPFALAELEVRRRGKVLQAIREFQASAKPYAEFTFDSEKETATFYSSVYMAKRRYPDEFSAITAKRIKRMKKVFLTNTAIGEDN